MRWRRVEREITFQHTDTQLYEVRTLVGWECSACHHTNWADRHPGVGCWSCGERDEEYGHDAVSPAAHRPSEALGKIQRPPDPETVPVDCPTCGLTITLYPAGIHVVAGDHQEPHCAAWEVGDIALAQLYQAYLARQQPRVTRTV